MNLKLGINKHSRNCSLSFFFSCMARIITTACSEHSCGAHSGSSGAEEFFIVDVSHFHATRETVTRFSDQRIVNMERYHCVEFNPAVRDNTPLLRALSSCPYFGTFEDENIFPL